MTNTLLHVFNAAAQKEAALRADIHSQSGTAMSFSSSRIAPVPVFFIFAQDSTPVSSAKMLQSKFMLSLHSPYLLVLTTRATSSEFQIIFSLFFCFNTVFHFLNSSYVSCPRFDFAEPYLTTFLTSPPFAVLPPVRTSCKLNYCAAHPSLLHHYDR